MVEKLDLQQDTESELKLKCTDDSDDDGYDPNRYYEWNEEMTE